MSCTALPRVTREHAALHAQAICVSAASDLQVQRERSADLP